VYEIPEDGIDVPKHVEVVEDYGCFCHKSSNTSVVRLILKLGNQQWKGKKLTHCIWPQSMRSQRDKFHPVSILDSSGWVF